MRIWWALVAASAIASAAHAADKPVIAPAPTWVKPVSLQVPPAGGDAPIRILLQDQQLDFEPGRQSTYVETAFRIQTPQGLAAAGNIAFAWRPDKDVLTVHKLQIRRGDQVIDVLASGQTFTVMRRETNLDNATLDGVLTATIQPEGLQVGDILDFAATITTTDPVLKGHVEALGAAWNGFPFDKAHFRLQWPSNVPVRLHVSSGLPPLKPVRTGNLSAVEFSLDKVEPVPPPKDAPARFALARLVEASDFDSWSAVAALMVPLYQKAAVIPAQGPLRTELEKIRAASTDPKTRAEAALALVQDRVRYVALAMGDGGLVPADAETTWSRRFGDCKGKTVLLLALLHELGIQAEAVLVSTALGDGMDQRLPMIGMFNHVLTRATIAGRTYWLDGTRTGDKRLDSIQVPSFGWGLPVVPSGAALVRIVPPPLDRPSSVVTLKFDASGGITVPVPVHGETVLRDDEALALNNGLVAETADGRDHALKNYWKERYDFIEPKTVTASFDAATGEERLVMDGTARMDWRGGRYETDGTGVGYRADFARDPGPNRDAPFTVSYPFFDRAVETIVLPQQDESFKIGDEVEVNETAGGIEYRRHATLTGNVFTIERTQRSIVPEIPASAAPAAQAALRALADKTAYLFEPANYVVGEKELAARMADTPTDAAGFLSRGNLLMDHHRYDEAIADFTKGLALEPKNAWLLADRGLSHAWKGEAEAAATDLDAAAAIDPANAVVFRARGLIAEHKGATADAVAAYTRSLQIEPDNIFALYHRALAYRSSGDYAHAADDVGAELKLSPKWVDGYLLRANLLRMSNRNDELLAEAAAAIAANPDDGYAHVVAARILCAIPQAGGSDAGIRPSACDQAGSLHLSEPSGIPPEGRFCRQAHRRRGGASDRSEIVGRSGGKSQARRRRRRLSGRDSRLVGGHRGRPEGP